MVQLILLDLNHNERQSLKLKLDGAKSESERFQIISYYVDHYIAFNTLSIEDRRFIVSWLLILLSGEGLEDSAITTMIQDKQKAAPTEEIEFFETTVTLIDNDKEIPMVRGANTEITLAGLNEAPVLKSKLSDMEDSAKNLEDELSAIKVEY